MPRQKKDKTQEDIDKNELINYFKSVTSEPINYAVYQKQLKDIKSKYPSYTYKGMKYCLWYIKEHQNIPIKSIAIVPYYYDDSKKYYYWLNDIKKKLRENNITNEKTITIKEIEEKIFE